MRVLLAAAAFLAAAAVPAAPAEAQSMAGAGFSVSSGGTLTGRVGHGRDGRHDGRRHRRGDAVLLDNWGYSDFDGGSAWRHDSFNDWWHERPHRAYPKWVNDGTCSRVYWAGGGWRC